jgi:phage terminase small subunit
MAVLENTRHELFAQAIAKGSSQREAYLNAGYDVKPEVADAAASRLLSDVRVESRVAELLELAATETEKTITDIVKMLEEDRAMARDLKQPSAAITAAMGIAKVLGLIVDKNELTGKNGGPIETADVTQDAERVAGLISELARRTSDGPTLQ